MQMKDGLNNDKQTPDRKHPSMNGMPQGEGVDLANLTRLQAAKLCGVAPATFDKWCRDHGLPYYLLPSLGNRRRFNLLEIREWQRRYRNTKEQKSVHSGIRKIG